jgi:hypothetical protein
MKALNATSVTVFAKCHHGMSYYPTKVGSPHPALGSRDLVGELIEALHREGIRAPLYTSVAWEENVATLCPDWRQVRRDGTFAQADNRPGAWRYMNFLHPDYQDYVEAHLRELFGSYEVDGIYFDAVRFHPDACWSDVCMTFREGNGLTGRDAETQEFFSLMAQAAFADRFAKLVRGLKPDATLCFNNIDRYYTDGTLGLRGVLDCFSHLEVRTESDSAPGYHHFPRIARHHAHLGKPWLAVASASRRGSGDFGGPKPEAALEYEAFRGQAHGGGVCLTDQLHPRGRLDQPLCDSLGRVLQQVADAEAFYADSAAVPQLVIIAPHQPGRSNDSLRSEEGAVLLTEQLHYDAAIATDANAIEGAPLILLPDDVVITPALRSKLEACHAAGGKLILSHRSGFDVSGNWALNFLPLEHDAELDIEPTYWRTRSAFWPEMSAVPRVHYTAGMVMHGGPGTDVLVDRVFPYFKRSDLKFCSHAQTPPMSEASDQAAVIAGEGFVYFADPVFREFRLHGNTFVRDVLGRVLEQLLGAPIFGAGLPADIVLIPRKRGAELILTLLRYRTSLTPGGLPVIESGVSFAGERLRMPANVRDVRDTGTWQFLARHDDGSFALPAGRGRLRLEVKDYFA